MKTSAAGLEFIKRAEGIRLQSYQDSAGIWTIGVGHTGKEVGEGQRITEDEALRLLAEDVEVAEQEVSRLGAMEQHQFDALVSLVFNIGVGAFRRSTLRKRITWGSRAEIIDDEWMRWVNAGGKRLPGLVSRRRREVNMYLGKQES